MAGSQVVRLDAGSGPVQLEWSVGPVPVGDHIGKEIISRFSATTIDSKDRYSTDSNGYETVERTRNQRKSFKINLPEPITANYYPINTALSIRDDAAQLTVTPDSGDELSSDDESSQDVRLINRREYREIIKAHPRNAAGVMPCCFHFSKGHRRKEGRRVRLPS